MNRFLRLFKKRWRVVLRDSVLGCQYTVETFYFRNNAEGCAAWCEAFADSKTEEFVVERI